MIPKFKMGDVVRCCLGQNKKQLHDNNGRGYGWEEGATFTINEINKNTETVIYWGNKVEGGVYEEALELYIPSFKKMFERLTK